jgi:transposase
VKSVAEELNVSYNKVQYWMKIKKSRTAVPEMPKARRPQDWTPEQQLVALHETHTLTGEALQTWCRESGVFTHHLTSWKTAFCADVKLPPGLRENRVLKTENDQLKRELIRKERALAEAAALLILQKKFRALWEEEVI